MPTTTNFGWTTPADTDLVKDGAAAMRTLGNSIDASFVDLKGGTTGQILSKASNTDLDYTWINNDQGDITEVVAGTGISGGGTSGSVTITNTMATAIDAKGDLIAGTGADTFSRLAVGSNNQVLTADSTTATGLKWATPSTGATWTEISAATPSGGTYTVSGFSGYSQLFVIFESPSIDVTTQPELRMRFNSDTGANYNLNGLSGTVQYSQVAATYLYLCTAGTNANLQLAGGVFIQNANSTGRKFGQLTAGTSFSGIDSITSGYFSYTGTSAITSISFITASGNWDAGTIRIFGA